MNPVSQFIILKTHQYRRQFATFAITAFYCSSIAAWAVPVPLRAVNELHLQDGADYAYRIKSAKVIVADYDLIRRDFPS